MSARGRGRGRGGGRRQERKKVFPDYTRQELTTRLGDRRRYKRCLAHVENARGMFAEVLDRDESDGVYRIKLKNRGRCDRAFENDTVVVEILEEDDPDERQDEDNEEEEDVLERFEDNQPQGKIIGVLRSDLQPNEKLFVCTADVNNTGNLFPLNRSIPKFCNHSTKEDIPQKRGQVTVFRCKRGRRGQAVTDFELDHYEPVDEVDSPMKTFLVQFMNWDCYHYTPQGVVIKVIHASNTVAESRRFFDIKHDVQMYYESGQQPTPSTIPASLRRGRLDMTKTTIFTIDRKGCPDMDDALSLDMTEDRKNFVVGVHISDVDAFVPKGSNLDETARQRGISLYPRKDEILHMLPGNLSTGLLSLKQGEDRLTLSIFITVSKSGDILEVVPKRCVIRSTHQLSFEEAEALLRSDAGKATGNLQDRLKCLLKITNIWKRKRLGRPSRKCSDENSKKYPRADQLVSETMMTANHQVALYLQRAYPDCVPLYRQLPPDKIELDAWRERHALDALIAPTFRQYFHEFDEVCICKGQCDAVQDFLQDQPQRSQDSVEMKIEAVNVLLEATEEGDVEVVKNMIRTPDDFPQAWLADTEMRKLYKLSEYVCSLDGYRNFDLHYSENILGYTHFTSPIRRYIDIVVHRMVIAAMEGEPCPYEQEEVIEICCHMRSSHIRSKRFEKGVRGIEMVGALQRKPLVAFPMVNKVDDHSFRLLYPLLNNLSGLPEVIYTSNCSTTKESTFDATGPNLTLHWQNRVYSLKLGQLPRQQVRGANMSGTLVLNPDRFVMKIPASNWQDVIHSALEDDTEALLECVKEKVRATPVLHTPEVTSEVCPGILPNHFCKYDLTIEERQIMRVQLGKGVTNGLLAPKLQLIQLTPKFSLCMEHKRDIGHCFPVHAEASVSRVKYDHEGQYRTLWSPALEMETVSTAIAYNDNFFIKDVAIEWKPIGEKVKETDDGMIVIDPYDVRPPGQYREGVFFLPKEFCNTRQIWLEDKWRGDVPDHYLCVKYDDVKVNLHGLEEQCRDFLATSLQPTWVGHCDVVSVTEVQSKQTGDHFKRIVIRLLQSNMDFPQVLPPTCTVEFIQKPVHLRRMQQAIWNLSVETAPMAVDVACSHVSDNGFVVNRKASELCMRIKDVYPSTLQPPNREQTKALKTALTKSFTMIEGAPGTGKTEIGAALAYLFTLMNGDTEKVLVCGPTEKSLDAVTDTLKTLGKKCPKLIRVYSELIESQHYPIPSSPQSARRKVAEEEVLFSEAHMDIALHHRIRSGRSKSSQKFLQCCKDMTDHPDKVGDLRDKYEELVIDCKTEVLKQADIILCICTEASRRPVERCGDRDMVINQVIIDDCAMCTEPEILTPLAAADPRQVVFIGDAKQLLPDVFNAKAKSLGFDIPLLKRYGWDTRKNTRERTITLTAQYRMDNSIAAFPSRFFYEDKVDQGLEDHGEAKFKWPGTGGHREPIIFAHVVGEETVAPIDTPLGTDVSWKNETEAALVVQYVHRLVTVKHVREEDIAILTQYRGQREEIRRRLGRQHSKVAVRTVRDSHASEWELVILSTVRSLPKEKIQRNPSKGWAKRCLGRTTDQNEINVALTRAREGLAIVGNKDLLKCDPMWQELLKDYEERRKIVDAKSFVI